MEPYVLLSTSQSVCAPSLLLQIVQSCISVHCKQYQFHGMFDHMLRHWVIALGLLLRLELLGAALACL